MRQWINFCLLLFFVSTGWTNVLPEVEMDMFMSSTCPHCQKAEVFFDNQAAVMPWLHVHKYLINREKANLEIFYQRLQQVNSTNFTVPAYFFCGTHWIGFDSVAQSGKKLMEALQYCREHSQQGLISAVHQKVLQKMADANFLSAKNQQYTDTQNLLFAGIDAFNACSFFFLIAFLAAITKEKTVYYQFSIGLSFILAVALMHWLQQNFLDSYVTASHWLRFPATIIGLSMLVSCLDYYPMPKIPLAFSFALLILVYQQTCTSLTQINAAWLSSLTLSSSTLLLYKFIYALLYLLPLSILLFLLIFMLKQPAIKAKIAPIFDLNRYVLAMIALCLIMYPWGLANNYLLICLLPLVIATWYFMDKSGDQSQ